MHRYLSYIILILFSIYSLDRVAAESTVESNRLISILTKVSTTSKSINSFEAKFVEERHVAVLKDIDISQGTILYEKPNKLTWKYTQSKDLSFTLDKGQTIVINNGKIEKDPSINAMFRQIGKMILSAINGEQLVDTVKYNATYSIVSNRFKVVLVPKDRKMQKFMSQIVFTFSLTNYLISTVELKYGESSTVIKFDSISVK